MAVETPLERAHRERTEAEERDRQRLEEERRNFITTATVYANAQLDSVHEDIGGIWVNDHQMLSVSDCDDRIIALYAPGQWISVELTREPRVHNDEDDETDDTKD